MNITFVCPPLNLSGGCRVVAIYAQLLKARGHKVLVASPAHGRSRSPFNIFGSSVANPQPASPFDGSSVPLVISRVGKPVCDADLPPADVVIATWWETAEWVARLGEEKGEKVYFVQGHEVYPWLPQARARAAYRLPLHKIVISGWLNDIMRSEYGDSSADVVHNGVDHSRFNSPVRGKQSRPTVGLLHSPLALKGFDVAMAALESISQTVPNLRVLTFGLQLPIGSLPEYVEFTLDPSPDELRKIYGSCDVWLTASRSEGFNLPAMEAMACRTPVVATATGWPAEAIINGANGACVAVDDAEALVHETKHLLTLPEAEWFRISQRAFETVRECSWERSADLFEQALERIVNRRAIAIE